MEFKEYHFNIHNLSKFKVYSIETPKHILQEYHMFISKSKIENPDIEIYLHRFEPRLRECYVIDNWLHIRKDYLYALSSYKIAKWEFEMDEKNNVIRVYGNIFSPNFIIGYLLNFMIRYKLNLKGNPVIHASAVSKAGKSVVFAGVSGSGKTLIALALLRRGFKLLSDDYVIISNGTVLGFPKPLNIFSYNVKPISKYLTPRMRISLFLRDLLYKLSLGYTKLFLKIRLNEISGNILEEKAELNTIFYLLPNTNKDSVNLKKVKKDELIDYLLFNEMIESTPMLNCILDFATIFPEEHLSRYFEIYRSNLERILDNCRKLYILELPCVIKSAHILNKIVAEILNGVSL